MSSWKCPLSREQRAALQALQPRQLGVGREQRRERREVERDARDARAPRAQSTASQTSHSLNPFGVVAQPRHRRERERAAGGQTAKWRKPGGAPAGVAADDEEGVLVVEPEERVERHHEAALRLGAAPVARDRLELAAQVLVDLARRSTSAR